MIAKIIDTQNLGFVSWADDVWEGDPPKPLRRILSLMRLANCQSFVLETRTWKKCGNNGNACWSSYETSKQSCSDYIENLCHYHCEFHEKICYRLSFFKKKIAKHDEIPSLSNDDFIGYCIVHKDTFKDKFNKERRRIYVTESVIDLPFRKGRYTVIGSETVEQLVCGVKFSVKGNYFAQQNGITNNCANAAIKMALRGKYPDITAERINEIRGVKHKEKAGSRGMKAKEICEAIKSLTVLDSYVLKSADLATPDLMRIIYHAVESRLPVILLISVANRGKKKPQQNNGHAIAVKGHSFNEHNWWSYGLTFYFAGKENLAYFPSSLWCDNFIIQDDNMGPYYLLPVKFLVGEYSPYCSGQKNNFFGNLLKVFKKNENSWLVSPYEIIIPYSKRMWFFKTQVLQVEPWALSILNGIVKNLLKETTALNDKPLSRYFTKYHENSSLIFRTYAIRKEKYLKHLSDDTNLSEHVERDVFDSVLPDSFWLTEISIPEVFWINKKKVGEIVTDPNMFAQDEESGVVYVRILNNLFFKKDGQFVPFVFDNSTRTKWLFPLASPDNC